MTTHASFTKIKRFTAFTLIEVLIATSILGLLAATTLGRLTDVRKSARDSRRRVDTKVINEGLQTSWIANGTYLVTVKGSSCVITPGATGEVAVGVGSGCTGANGVGFGLANLRSGGSGQTPITVTVTSTIHPSTTYTYANAAIVPTLKANGFLATEPRDPQSTSVYSASSPDYAIITCCVGGQQKDAGNGAYAVAVAQLEGSLSNTDISSTANFCGGTNQQPDAIPGYQYDYAAPTGRMNANLYAIGNGSPKSTQAKAGSCGAVAMAK